MNSLFLILIKQNYSLTVTSDKCRFFCSAFLWQHTKRQWCFDLCLTHLLIHPHIIAVISIARLFYNYNWARAVFFL